MKSFVKYEKFCDYPIENLPYGVFSSTDNVSEIPIAIINNKIVPTSKMFIIIRLRHTVGIFDHFVTSL